MVPRGWPTVCYSCGSENSNSKSSKLLLSWGYYHMCAISIDWQLPLDQLGTIDLAALHFKLIVLEMRSTLPGIPLFGRWIFIFIWQDVDIRDTGYIDILFVFTLQKQFLLQWLAKQSNADNRLKKPVLGFSCVFLSCDWTEIQLLLHRWSRKSNMEYRMLFSFCSKKLKVFMWNRGSVHRVMILY